MQFERLFQVPGNRLALAVRIGGQVDRLGPGSARLQAADNALAAVGQLVLKLIAGSGHAQGTLRQITHMAHAGGHIPPRAEQGLDLLHLVRALDNHQLHPTLRERVNPQSFRVTPAGWPEWDEGARVRGSCATARHAQSPDAGGLTVCIRALFAAAN